MGLVSWPNFAGMARLLRTAVGLASAPERIPKARSAASFIKEIYIFGNDGDDGRDGVVIVGVVGVVVGGGGGVGVGDSSCGSDVV